MKKIAQGRDRRRQRQMEAAERQAASTRSLVTHTQKQLELRKKELRFAKGEDARVLTGSVASWEARLKALVARGISDDKRLVDLSAGNYPR